MHPFSPPPPPWKGAFGINGLILKLRRKTKGNVNYIKIARACGLKKWGFNISLKIKDKE